jgi:hypothetical protein
LFSQFSKILDRTFVIGYILPLSAFMAVSLWLLGIYELAPEAIDLSKIDVLRGTTAFGLVAWLGGMILVLLNGSIYRVLEGYGKWNPIRLLWGPIGRWRFARLQKKAEKLDEEALKSPELADCLKGQRREVLTKLAQRFPDEQWVLATSLGNIIRAFEVYPRIMYGLEDIQGWDRLLAVLPKNYITLIDDAKSRTDFWLNLTVLSFLALLEYAGLGIYTRRFQAFWSPPLLAAAALVAYKLTGEAALEWGELCKSAYDVFLPKLLEAAHFQLAKTKEEDYERWRQFSQAIIYRRPDLMPERQYVSPCDAAVDEDRAKPPEPEDNDGEDEDKDAESNGPEGAGQN